MATTHQFDKQVHTIQGVRYVEDVQCPACKAKEMLIFGMPQYLLNICPHCQSAEELHPIPMDDMLTGDEKLAYPREIKYNDALKQLKDCGIDLIKGKPVVLDWQPQRKLARK
jgi:Zn ribbon nucleic-acid-binding protein